MACELQIQGLRILEPAHHREHLDEDSVAIQRAVLRKQAVQHNINVELIDRDECPPPIGLVDAHDALVVFTLGFAGFDLVRVCEVALKFSAIGALARRTWFSRLLGLWCVGNRRFLVRSFVLQLWRVDSFSRLLPSLLRGQLLCPMLQAAFALFPELVTGVPLPPGVKCLFRVAF